MIIERMTALRSIERFSTIPIMKYRTTLADHYIRVNKLLNALRPTIQYYFPEYRHRLALAIAAVHDDPELITGDIPTNIKEKMTVSEKNALERRECAAITELQKHYSPLSNRRLYGWLMSQAQSKATVEAQIVSVADKIDGFGEAFREIYNGNTFFLAAADEYINRVNNLPIKYPMLQGLFAHNENQLLQPVPPVDVLAIIKNTHHNTRRLTGISVYDEWRKITE